KAKAARERLKQKIAESKKEELSEKAKELLAQADQVDKEAKAARERLEEKIAQSKKEELSDRAKALIAQADQADKEAQNKSNSRSHVSYPQKGYKEMTPKEQHEALKSNSDEAWKGLKEDLLSGRTDDAVKALSAKNNSSEPFWSGTYAKEFHDTLRGEFWGSKIKPTKMNFRFVVTVKQKGHLLSGSVIMFNMDSDFSEQMLTFQGKENGYSASVTLRGNENNEVEDPYANAKLSKDKNRITVTGGGKTYILYRVK
uniref:hypothetical protein n=1 Tax=Sulfurovum sp. TaxID=1969726 RepID=UPI0025FF45E9